MIKLIAALDYQNGIGKGNDIPWYIPEDLKRFKKLTTDNIVIMGRKTWDSLPKQPLPNRTNIVITSKQPFDKFIYDWDKKRFLFGCLQGALDVFGDVKYHDVYIIGGGSIYREALDLDIVDEMDLTWIKGDYNCDVHFPDVNWDNWEELNSHETSDISTVVRYKRKR